jgi:hypothetical protein
MPHLQLVSLNAGSVSASALNVRLGMGFLVGVRLRSPCECDDRGYATGDAGVSAGGVQRGNFGDIDFSN